MSQHPLTTPLLQQKIVVILRGLQPENAVATGDALARAGIHFLEVPLNRPGALEAIRLLARHFQNSDTYIGAGTVLAPQQVDDVFAVGGQYIISPNTRASVIARTKELGMLSIPGFATPSEAFDAIDAGADILKAFPCGTPENIAVLKSVIPLPVLAVGGITRENKCDFLKTADGLGVGIGIYQPSMTPDEVFRSATEFIQA